PPSTPRLLHVLCAGGLRVAARAAAEALRDLGGLEMREHLGKTPLLVAATAAAPGIVQDLLVLGADPDAADHRGRTALHLAAAYGHPEILQVRPQPQNPPASHVPQAHGNTPLHMAAALPGTPSQEPLVRLLLAWGADPSARNLEHDLPQGLLPPGPPGDQLRLLLRSRRGSRRSPPTTE
ncbi:NF-kappa-B inhibitor delta, partial [Manacus vitellinus]|uniref:NF-kappa-B inhibitor delta n=1 Tax=Manacus vitellinus TaxID=328815 RepID=UPI00115EB95B